MAQGYFDLNSSRVYRNATVLDGSTIRTAAVSSDVRLNSGARLTLAPGSEVKIYRNGFESAGLRISPAEKSQLAVANRGKVVQIAALRGTATVTKADGLTLARLEAGKAMEFDPQAAGAAAPTTVKGTLKQANGRYLLTDTTTNVTFEVVGGQIGNLAGKVVVITGTVDAGTQAAAGASQVLRVITAQAAATRSGGGMGLGAKVIIAGVAVAATGAGIGVAASRNEEATPISR